MKVVIFGASGMVGQGALRECLKDPGVERVAVVGRSPSGRRHEKLTEFVHADFFDFGPLAGALAGFDACFYSLGVSSAGMSEADYTRVTHDITLAAAAALLPRNPAMTFVFVSGTGTDSTEKGRTMWARVKGRTENAVLRFGFKSAYALRPAFIRPMDGIRSKTRSYRVFYAICRPIFPLLNLLVPSRVTTTERLGRAMLALAREGYGKPVLENRDLNEVAARAKA
jgi:uncharacterized protein YbjT (DUF2867 family)